MKSVDISPRRSDVNNGRLRSWLDVLVGRSESVIRAVQQGGPRTIEKLLPETHMTMYTKNGKPLQAQGNYIYSQSGRPVGQVRGRKVFGPDGRYVGSIDGDRLVYRSTESAEVSAPFSIAHRAGSAVAHAAGSAIWGDEPNIPD